MESSEFQEASEGNSKMVNQLIREKVIKSDIVERVMKMVDRADFCSGGYLAYADSPQSIRYGATISAPHMHAYALEYLKDYFKEDGRCLDVGSGSGYLCAAFSKMMNGTGKVVGIEHIDKLAKLGIDNLSKNYKDELDDGRIEIINGDGRKGYEDQAPYNVIHCQISYIKTFYIVVLA